MTGRIAASTHLDIHSGHYKCSGCIAAAVEAAVVEIVVAAEAFAGAVGVAVALAIEGPGADSDLTCRVVVLLEVAAVLESPLWWFDEN
jgi:cation transporter-like permease